MLFLDTQLLVLYFSDCVLKHFIFSFKKETIFIFSFVGFTNQTSNTGFMVHCQKLFLSSQIGKVLKVYCQFFLFTGIQILICDAFFFRHKIIAPILQNLQKHKPKNYILRDPWWTWCWILTRPFILYLALIIFVNVLTTQYHGYQGYIVTVGVLYLVWSMMSNIHRIQHISR